MMVTELTLPTHSLVHPPVAPSSSPHKESQTVRSLFCVVVLSLFLPATAVAQSWNEITPLDGSAPAPRRHASAVYDASRHQMVIFGGENGTGRLADIWAFDLASNTWTDLTPAIGTAPSPRRTPGSVYDPLGDRMVTWAGQGGGFFNDTWSFDLATNTWTEQTPTTVPNPRYGVAVCYDPVTGELVTFAGFTNAGRFDDTWRFDPVAETWTDATPAGTSPPKRCLHSASYDSREHRMIMYAGQQNGPLDDIWAFDLTTDTWNDVTPVARPAGRFFTAHVYDALNHRSTIFGGQRGAAGGGATNEVWLFDLFTDEFVQMTPSGTPPSAREGSTGIYIESEDRMVVFGGYDTDYRGDVWSLEDLSLTATDTPAAPRNGELVLYPSRPNPFNPSTTLRFVLPGSGRTTLRIYDVAGREVTELVDGRREAGEATVRWDGRGADGSPMPSGVYFAQLRQGEWRASQKLVLAK